MRLRLLPRTDIATVRCCDAIATSANAALVGNGNPNYWRFAGKHNVDGAVHRAAGPRLLEACQSLTPIGGGNAAQRCGVGDAVVTPAFDLHAGLVIHAVAPDGLYGSQPSSSSSSLSSALPETLLCRTYTAILEAARGSSIESLALPAVGCGVLGFRAGVGAKIALKALIAQASSTGSGGVPLRVDVALLDDSAFTAWSRTARALLGEPQALGGGAGVEVYEDVISMCKETSRVTADGGARDSST